MHSPSTGRYTTRTLGTLVRAWMVAISTVLWAPDSQAQERPAPAGAEGEAIRVFMDCVRLYCDTDFLRSEINFVNHVRDRQDADVHVLVTTEETGGGGTEYTLEFIGLGRYASLSDTLRWNAPVAASQDDIRGGLARTIKLGLVRFVASTPRGTRLEITYKPAANENATGVTPAHDRWNYWVFQLRGNGNVNGEKSSRSFFGWGSFSASRTTEAWKVSTDVNVDYSESKFDYDGTKYNSYSHSYGTNALVVKSLGQHWSAGGRASAQSSTRVNQDLGVRIAPAVEYNFFPYSEATRRALTLQYSVGIRNVNYTEETIFDKTSEMLADEMLTVNYDLKRKWGSISTWLEGAHYLHDPSKWHLEDFLSVDVKLFKGLSLNGFGSASLIRDQLFLPKASTAPEDVLLQRRQLATGYRYFAGFGLTYSFGSIYNNIVNTRFGGSGGTFFF
jgi:hypothetical protein